MQWVLTQTDSPRAVTSYDKCSKNDGTEKGCSTETHLGNDERLADRPVTTPRTDNAGCKINRINKPKNDSQITYSKHVARILRDPCVACHPEGEIAPFAMERAREDAGYRRQAGYLPQQRGRSRRSSL
jgi:hypothetical protein